MRKTKALRKIGINVVILNAAPSAFFELYVAIHKQYILSILLVSNGVSIFALVRSAIELRGYVWYELCKIFGFCSRRFNPGISVGCYRHTRLA